MREPAKCIRSLARLLVLTTSVCRISGEGLFTAKWTTKERSRRFIPSGDDPRARASEISKDPGVTRARLSRVVRETLRDQPPEVPQWTGGCDGCERGSWHG